MAVKIQDAIVHHDGSIGAQNLGAAICNLPPSTLVVPVKVLVPEKDFRAISNFGDAQGAGGVLDKAGKRAVVIIISKRQRRRAAINDVNLARAGQTGNRLVIAIKIEDTGTDNCEVT